MLNFLRPGCFFESLFEVLVWNHGARNSVGGKAPRIDGYVNFFQTWLFL